MTTVPGGASPTPGPGPAEGAPSPSPATPGAPPAGGPPSTTTVQDGIFLEDPGAGTADLVTGPGQGSAGGGGRTGPQETFIDDPRNPGTRIPVKVENGRVILPDGFGTAPRSPETGQFVSRDQLQSLIEAVRGGGKPAGGGGAGQPDPAAILAARSNTFDPQEDLPAYLAYENETHNLQRAVDQASYGGTLEKLMGIVEGLDSSQKAGGYRAQFQHEFQETAKAIGLPKAETAQERGYLEVLEEYAGIHPNHPLNLSEADLKAGYKPRSTHQIVDGLHRKLIAWSDQRVMKEIDRLRGEGATGFPSTLGHGAAGMPPGANMAEDGGPRVNWKNPAVRKNPRAVIDAMAARLSRG